MVRCTRQSAHQHMHAFVPCLQLGAEGYSEMGQKGGAVTNEDTQGKE